MQTAMKKVASLDCGITEFSDGGMGGAYVDQSKIPWPFVTEEDRRLAFLMAQSNYRRLPRDIYTSIPKEGFLELHTLDGRQANVLTPRLYAYEAAIKQLTKRKQTK